MPGIYTMPTATGPLRRSESLEAAAARLKLGPAELASITASLSCKPQEVQAAEYTPDGLVVDLAGDCNRLVHRPADRPDANGRTGWLRYTPHRNAEREERRVSAGAAPLFARPGDDGPRAA